MGLRRKLENSERLAGLIGGLLALYLRMCIRTTRWDIHGADAFRKAADEGPVILVMWHSRILLAPAHVARAGVRLKTLRDPSPAGRLSGAVQKRFALEPIAMSAKASNLAASREVLRHLRSGGGLGLTADGPLGPALALKPAPLEWARASGAPVFVFAYATARQRRLRSWDKLLFPLPFTKGAAIFARWSGSLDRRADADLRAKQTSLLTDAMNSVQAKADQGVGHKPGP